MRFSCKTCGQEHSIDDVSFGSDAPLQWGLLTDEERAQSMLSGEQCEIERRDGDSFYIRACLEIPIRGTDRIFTWGVWCSLSEKSYVEVSEHWEDPARPNLGPYFGWLSSIIPGYPDTAYLKTHVHQREVGVRPSVELEPTNHPLSLDQRHGVDSQWLQALVTGLLHGHVDIQHPLAPAATKEQEELCQRYKAKVEPPLPGSTMGIALKSLSAKPTRGIRYLPSKDSNGWYIWAGEQSTDPDFYQSVCIEHIGDHSPIVLPFLALPPGWAFITDGSYVDVWFDPKFLVQ